MIEITPQESIYQQQQAMLKVVKEMKEIPELPSEQPKDVSILEKVDFPDEGGVLTFMGNHPYPYRGFPYYEFVDRIDFIKKTSRALLSSLYHSFKNRNRIWIVLLFPSILILKPLVKAWIYVYYRMVERFKIKPIRYSRAVRELHRSFSIEPEKDCKELRLHTRDLVCMILENDNAYRFRFQDIITDLNKENLEKNPIKELIRLLEIMQTNEIGQDVKDTWTLFKLFIRFYLKYDKKLCQILVRTLQNLEIDQMKLTNEDKYYCSGRKDYTFRWILRSQGDLSNLDDEQKNDRLIYEIFQLADERTKRIALCREEYIKRVDALNTTQAVEKESSKDDLSVKHQSEHKELVDEFQPRFDGIDKQYREDLEKIKQLLK